MLAAIPAAVRFVSYEPALLSLDVSQEGLVGYPDWLICGGESGPNARPMNIEWFRSALRQCRQYGIAPFVKQMGSRAGLKDSKGSDPSEWPEDLRVQEWPS